MLKGNIIAPNETLTRVTKDLDSEFEQVLWRWNRQYNRYSRPLPPSTTEITAATPTPTRSKLRRQLEKLRSESKLDTPADDELIEESENEKGDEDEDVNTQFFDALITNIKSVSGRNQTDAKSKRNPSNRIFKPHARAHFSDSDDSDRDDYYLKPKSSDQNMSSAILTVANPFQDDDDDDSKTGKLNDKTYLPRIYHVNDVYYDD